MSDNESFKGSFTDMALSQVGARLHSAKASGVLRTFDPAGYNCLFLREGHPVGVTLVNDVAPLGLVLMEFGFLDREGYDQAEQHVVYLQRVAEEVYRELGVLTPEREPQVAQVQGLRRVGGFINTCSGDFEFVGGLGALVGFSSVVLPIDVLVVNALLRDFGLAEREAYLQNFGTRQVCATAGLVEPLALYNLGPNEEQFIGQLGEWVGVDQLEKWKVIPRPQISLMLRALDLLGRLDVRLKPELSNPRIRLSELTDRPPDMTPQMGWKDPRSVRSNRSEEEEPSVVVDLKALGITDDGEG
ncbi:MAG: hypothetical protein ABIJ09_03710 [Pseudomonadota bacterium]